MGKFDIVKLPVKNLIHKDAPTERCQLNFVKAYFDPSHDLGYSNHIRLIESLKKYGQVNPVLVFPTDDPDIYRVNSGNHRFAVAKVLGWETIDAMILEEWPDVHSALRYYKKVVGYDK